MSFAFTPRRPARCDRCEQCGQAVLRVWLVPGDILNSCARCFTEATGRPPVQAQGHSTEPGELKGGQRHPATFYLRVDGRRPA